ncbi:serine protease, partial [Staphylococcus hominis]
MKFKKSLITALATITLVPSLMILDTQHEAKAVGNYYY